MTEWSAATSTPGPRHRAEQSRLVSLGLGLAAAILLTLLANHHRSYGEGSQRRLWHAVRPRTPLAPPPIPKFPWRPLLTADELQQGTTHYGSGARMRRVAHKLLTGRPIKVVTLGGSVTYGHGADNPSLSYPSLFFRFINASFPHRDHVFRNQGMPGSTSHVTMPCLESMVAEDPDLVAVEFSVNDPPAAYTSTSRHSFEDLIRKLLAYGSQPAVVLLHHYSWWKAAADGLTSGVFYREPEGQYTTFSQYYDIPSLSLRSAAWHLMRAGVTGFKVDKLILEGNKNAKTGEPIPTADPDLRDDYLYLDTIHPGPNGHQVLAELLSGLLSRAVGEVAAGQPPARARRDPRLEGLPPPMIPNFEASSASLCVQLEAFKPMVVRQKGFEYRPEKAKMPTWVEQKWGWSATEPGSWAELEVDTRPKPGSQAKRTALLLSHLRSYNGMGTARVECVSGCSCEPNTLDGTTASRVSVFKIHSFKVSRHERCRIRVTVTSEPGETPQEGHKVMLAAVMVTHKLD